MAVLEQYSWPGNARELANLVERLAVMRPDGLVDAAALPWPLRPARSQSVEPQDAADGIDPASTLPPGGLDLKQHLASLERDLISAALERADGVVQQAADDLGLRRTTLVEKINRLNLRTGT
jgi:sigma-54 specific flagellar transcriptional regulator A